ncbi:hypothetical protein AM625_16000, partial [Vibrio cholerae O1 biovar El Tor]
QPPPKRGRLGGGRSRGSMRLLAGKPHPDPPLEGEGEKDNPTQEGGSTEHPPSFKKRRNNV